MYKRAFRFNSGSSKVEQYAVFNPHTKEPLVGSNKVHEGKFFVNGVFIDPGVRNCAVRIANYNIISGKITTVLQKIFDFTKTKKGDEERVGRETFHYTNMNSVLSEYVDYFIWSHYIVIESQLPINYDLVRMSQHLISFFTHKIADKGYRPLIIEIDAKMKSQPFGAPKMKKPELKKWCRNKAIEILTARGDVETANFIASCKKADDHGDTVCYEEVWWTLIGYRDEALLRYIESLKNKATSSQDRKEE
jgi:hypothetical protein